MDVARLRIWLVLFLIASGRPAFSDAGALAPLSHDLVIQDCQVLYHNGLGHTCTKNEEKAQRERVRFERRRFPDAKRFFDGMTAAQVRATLEPRIRQAQPGSDAYTSMAYVLADHRVEIHKNLERMKAADGRSSIEDTEAVMPIRMVDLYHKFKQDFVLDEFYSVEADGELAEALDNVRARMITQFPLHITHYFLRKRNGAQRLVDEFKGPALDYHAWDDGRNALRQVARNADPKVARFARVCLLLMARDKEMTPAEERSEKADGA